MAATEESTAPRARFAPDWERLHLLGAMLGVALQPLSTATGNIGFGIALGCTLPRCARLLPAWRGLWQRRWVRWMLAWLAWSAISLLWSSDRLYGATELKACRVLLWIPVLWPLGHHWWRVAGAMLAGTTALQVLQAVQLRTGWPIADRFPPGSVWTTPTQTGLWDAVSVSFWLMLAVMAGWRSALACVPMCVLSATGLVWSATRASVIGLAIELVVANAVLAWTSRGWWRRALLRCVVGAAILAGVSTFARSALQAKLNQAATELRATVESPQGVTSEYRLAMWRMAIEGWTRYPLCGVGMGGIPESIARFTTVTCPNYDMPKTRMVHSTYVQALTETGVVGAVLLLGWLVLVMRDAWRGVQRDPVRIIAWGGTLLWLVAAAFDGYQQSGGFLTVGAILMALACGPANSPSERPLFEKPSQP